MDILQIFITVLIMAVFGLFLGFLIAMASKFLYVKKDERIDLITEQLPGANCGGCGFAGCGAYAEAVVSGKAPTNKCPVGGDGVAKEVAKIMGAEAQKPIRMRAQVLCSGTSSLASKKYNYIGLEDCLSVAKLGNGPKECPYGCIGLGSCMRACPFGAIKVENGVAVVEYEKCRACGICVSACPQHLIELIPFDTEIWIGCRSHDKGSTVRSLCKVGCIGCGLCAKVCPSDAITLTDSVAKIDYAKCVNCGACVEKCPRKIIWSGKIQMSLGDTIASVNDTANNTAEDTKEPKKRRSRVDRLTDEDR